MELKSAYIITKPLQYINATNIPDENLKDCFLINLFSNSEIFYEEIKMHSRHWSIISLYKSRYSAMIHIIKNRKQYSSLFVDSDYGILITFLFFLIPTINIFTYEEGYGSYRYIRDNKKIKDKIKNAVYSSLGSKNWIGGNKCTKGIYLYNPEIFSILIKDNLNKELFSFKNNFYIHLNSLLEISHFYDSINFKQLNNKSIVVYLTTWTINSMAKEQILKFPNYVRILKPHPHIKNHIDLDFKFDIIIENSFPAEILLNQLVTICSNLVIIHENSSALMYLPNKKYTEINISENSTKNEYNNILKKIKSTSNFNLAES